jgi:hypothetical protein
MDDRSDNLFKLQFNLTDFVIFLSAIILALWLYDFFWFDQGSVKPQKVTIQYSDHKPQSYPLDEAKIITVQGHLGPGQIEIRPGKARFIHSACHNQYCVLHGWLTQAGETMACLPNRISISLEGTNTRYDAINF